MGLELNHRHHTGAQKESRGSARYTTLVEQTIYLKMEKKGRHVEMWRSGRWLRSGLHLMSAGSRVSLLIERRIVLDYSQWVALDDIIHHGATSANVGVASCLGGG